MQAAYVDSSWLIAITFDEGDAARLERRLDKFDRLMSSNLLEAEWRSVCSRENVVPDAGLLDRISWIIPDRPLHDEIRRVLAARYVRGADCWHIASALFITESPEEIVFLTLDKKQLATARTLGFRV